MGHEGSETHDFTLPRQQDEIARLIVSIFRYTETSAVGLLDRHGKCRLWCYLEGKLSTRDGVN